MLQNYQELANGVATILQSLRAAAASAANQQGNDEDGRYSPTDQPLIAEVIHISDDDDLPPGEDAPQPPSVFEGPRRRPSRGLTPPPRPQDPVDMDLGSEKEAEIQFFKEQRSEAPTWQDQPPPAGGGEQPPQRVPQFVNEEDRYEL